MFKKVILLTLSFFGFSLFPGNLTNQVTIIDSTQQTIYGATHERVQRTLQVGSSSVLQTYHYLGADFDSGEFRIITGDDYTSTGYRLATTKKHAEVSQAKYDEYLIIGGVNADFFSGTAPIEAYVEDGQVISSGQGYYREVIGFKENGQIALGTPEYDGYEIIIQDAVGKERIRLPIKNINASYVNHPFDIYVYFDTYSTTLPNGIPKYLISTNETKGAIPRIFGQGTYQSSKTEAHTMTSGTLAIVSNNPYLAALLETGDQVTINRKMTGAFEGVKWAVGGWGKLVINGVKNTNIVSVDPTLRHPRTAIGVKADGSVFFIAADGRQIGYSQGMTLYELADLMLDYGAVDAYNLDGGGSTTMVLRTNTNTFEVVNQPSDNPPRSVTNSVFLALQVRFDDTTPHEIPDYSTPLNPPTNLVIQGDRLTFQGQTGAKEYQVTINDVVYTTKSQFFTLPQAISSAGLYTITVQAIGDGFYYKSSELSAPFPFDYPGAIPLESPNQFRLTTTTLYWDESDPHTDYRFTINGKTYTLFLNRFTISTLNLTPGTYIVEVQKLGDGFVHGDSEIAYFTFRVYSAVEKEVLASMGLIKEIFILFAR